MKMNRKYIRVYLLVLSVLFSEITLSFSQLHDPEKTLASRVVWHFVARALINPNFTSGEVVGYFTDVNGVAGPLFNGPPSEMTAFLTLKTDVFTMQPLPNNGNVLLSLLGPGDLHVYFNPNPGNNWNDPATFSSGKEIARFNRGADVVILVGTVSSDTFSLDLVSSQDFTINGQELNFKNLAPHGVTNSNTGSGTPVPGTGNFPFALPFLGSGIAIGNQLFDRGERADAN
jgi:hypothetical protein